MEVIACWRLPKLMPEAYEKATMKLSMPVLRVLLVLSIALNVATFFVSLADMTTAEIAQVLGLKPAAVRQRLTRARAMLRELLEEEDLLHV